MPERRGIATPALLLSIFLPAAPCLAAQEDWENKPIADVVFDAKRESHVALRDQSGLKKGLLLTKERLDQAYKALWALDRFADVRIETDVRNGQVYLSVRVQEYEIIDRVLIVGAEEIKERQLRQDLSLLPGETLNPFHLKRDREKLREQYLAAGYAFSGVEDSVKPSGGGGVILTWTITEGPLVGVREIDLTGIEQVREAGLEGELRNFLLTKENSTIFGCTTSRNPYVELKLKQDLDRIRLFYRLQGWLDISVGERVFLRDVEYSGDKGDVTIRIHVDEGRRYRVRRIAFEVDAAGPRLFPPEEMAKWLESKPGEPYVEDLASRDLQRIRDRYGERAYIQAEISFDTITRVETTDLDLVFRIKENDKIYVGRLVFEGNTKTREEVFRREFTRLAFAPGEEFNRRSLERAIRRVSDRGYTDPGGLTWRTQEGDDAKTRDVLVEVREGQSGTVRFAAGYSSSYGVLGILEFTQRNFDIADLPGSLADLTGGSGFAGGGQFFRIRLAPAAERQSYSVDFREPYVFGHEFGGGIRVYKVNTVRESYNDDRLGMLLTLDKRFDPFTFQVAFKAEDIEVDEVEFGAPLAVQELEGRSQIFSIAPGIVYDSRDSLIFPTSGFRTLLSVEFAGQIMAGDYDFNKLTWETEGHVTLYETESKLKHVLSYQTTFGWAHAARNSTSVPLFERFYAGGRDSIRGFDFREMGPHEQGDPVGGEAYVFFSVEYSWPLFVEFLRGAFFYDLANLTPEIEGLFDVTWRNTLGFGIRFLIPQLGNVPVKLDFGWALTSRPEDEEEVVTFDIGSLF
jgi:outer membrane protein insertion porin family